MKVGSEFIIGKNIILFLLIQVSHSTISTPISLFLLSSLTIYHVIVTILIDIL